VIRSSWLSPAPNEKAEGWTRISPPVALVDTSNDSVSPLTLVAVLVVVTEPGMMGALMLGRLRWIRARGSRADAT
jgi:hypothetical protein